MKEIIVTGASVEEAVDSGCQQLGIRADEAQYEVIEEPKTGWFFSRPAKVRVYFDEVAKDDAFDEDDDDFVIEDEAAETLPEIAEEEEVTADEPEDDEEASEDKDEEDEEAEEDQEEVQELQEAEDDAEVMDDIAEPESAEPENYAEATEAAIRYLYGILEKMGVRELNITSETDGERTILKVNGNDDDLGVVIGHRGDTLTALQYLVSLAANNCCKGYFKVSLNVKNFREKRERTLETVASKTAYKASKLQKNIALEPMSPYERSIIHTAVQGIEGVTSWSVGENEKRHVVIGPIGVDEGGEGMPAKYAKVGGNRGGYGRSNYGGSRGGYNRGGRGSYGSAGRGGYRKNYRDGGYREDRGGYRENRGYRDDRRDNRYGDRYSDRYSNRYNENRTENVSESRPVTRTKSSYESGFSYGKIDIGDSNKE